MGILEELDALHDRKTLIAMYRLATANKHDFWFINLLSDNEQMFFKNMTHSMVVN